MVQFRGVEDVEKRVRAAPFKVCRPVDYERNASEYNGAGTHTAWFFGDIECGIGESPVSNGSSGLSDGDHFRVGSWIFEEFCLVVGLADDGAGRAVIKGGGPDYYTAGRHFALVGSSLGLFEGHLHVFVMIVIHLHSTLSYGYLLVKQRAMMEHHTGA